MNQSSHKPHVLHAITTIARGGAENHLVDLITGQIARGWEVSVAYLKADGDRYWAQHLRDMGVTVADLGLGRYGEIGPVFALRRFIDQRQPTLVHAHMPPAEIYTRLALLAGNPTPLVISKHLDGPFMRAPLDGVLEQWCARRASRVIAISCAVAAYFERRWPSRLGEKIRTIRYGLDPAPYDAVEDDAIVELRREWGIRAGELVIGTVARLTVQKALDVMIRGFASAVRNAPDGQYKLVIVGRGEDEAQLRRLCAECGVEDLVVFAGFRTDIARVMRSFDVFALTSDFEGFGLVLLEAMSASKPVVATGVSAIPEVVADEINGILVPRQDDQAFAAALARLRDPSLRTTFGEAGRSRVEQSFSLDVMVDATLAQYREVVG